MEDCRVLDQRGGSEIYMPEYAKYSKVIDLYRRKDNPLLISEIGNPAEYACYV